jgi:hypothetical protein
LTAKTQRRKEGSGSAGASPSSLNKKSQPGGVRLALLIELTAAELRHILESA